VSEFVPRNERIGLMPTCKTNLYVKGFPITVMDGEDEREFGDEDLR